MNNLNNLDLPPYRSFLDFINEQNSALATQKPIAKKIDMANNIIKPIIKNTKTKSGHSIKSNKWKEIKSNPQPPIIKKIKKKQSNKNSKPKVLKVDKPFKILDLSTFNKMFKNQPIKVPNIDMDEYKFSTGPNLSPLKSTGALQCLILAIRCLGINNELEAIGIGHFSSFEIAEYENEESLIDDFIEEACEISSAKRIDIFATGMHSNKEFEPIKETIASTYEDKIRKFEALINPWKMIEGYLEGNRGPIYNIYAQYLDVIGFALRAGVTEDGSFYVADQSKELIESPQSKEIPKSPQFIEFSEKKFKEWKPKKN